MRTSEISYLKRDCLFIEEGKKYLHIDRIKGEQNEKFVPYIKDFEITDFVYDFIKEFVDYANSVDNSNYLLSIEVIKSVNPNKDAMYTTNKFLCRTSIELLLS